MSRILEIPDPLYNALKKAADASGLTPVDWIAAHLPQVLKATGVETDKTLRPLGLCAGEFTVPDDFDAPLPETVIKEFEGA